jgi:hypothetical protein
MRISRWLLAAVLGVGSVLGSAAAAEVPSPKASFGFTPGADRKLVDYGELIDYLEQVAAASPRFELREIGRSELGRPIYLGLLSSEANLTRLDELREINRRLALDPAIPDAERERMVGEGRVFVLATLSMHASEVGPAQALPLLVHELVTSEDPAVVDQLERVVLMVVPTHNPDGMDMVVESYRASLGTPFEGGPLPGIYNRYTGHDNNRDFVNLTQSETRAVSGLYTTDWFPQVHVDKHQMGGTGPRYYVPNVHDPIAENIDEGVWTWAGVFGSNLANDMAGEGLRGVATHWLFDNYWPGSTETALWKNVISFLTEAASCRVATPVFVEPSELETYGKGLSEYKKSINMPDPWPGGWWRLSDIVRYELVTMRSILQTAARHRAEILRFRNELCRSEVAKGLNEAPYYFLLPRRQHDPGALAELLELLGRHSVELRQATERIVLDGRVVEPGDVVVPLAQPYRAFVKEVLERQRYPVRHYTPDGEVILPYDVTSWSLPLHRGLEFHELGARSAALESSLAPVDAKSLAARVDLPDDAWGLALPASANASFRAIFAALGDGLRVDRTAERASVSGAELAAGSFVLRGPTARLARFADAPGAVVLAADPGVATAPVHPRRVGLVETYFHDMDAGWTRYLLDGFAVPYKVLRPGDFESTDLAATFDVLLFPDVGADILTKGKRKVDDDDYRPTEYPPDYAKPISEKGLGRLRAFLAAGGVVVSWQASTELFLEELGGKEDSDELPPLPARDVADELEERGLDVPGSLLRAKILADHPLTWGMPSEVGVFSVGRPVFATSIPRADADRRVIATYPEGDILLSGYIEGEEQLAGKPAMVWLRSGRGQLVLFGFNPHFRASMGATYKLLFNALLLPEPAP